MTMTTTDRPQTQTGILRRQDETAVSSYKTVIIEQQERIAALEAQLANVTERAARIGNVALETLSELSAVSLERSRYRAALWQVARSEDLETAKRVARGAVRR